jgi:hypothetical protein
VLDSIKSDERVLRLIGIPEVDIENVVDQLEVIGKIEFQSTEGLEDICDRLYTTLNTCLEPKEAGRFCNYVYFIFIDSHVLFMSVFSFLF